MNVIRTRLHVAEDGTITGQAPPGLPPSEHEAEIAVCPAAATPFVSAEADLRARIGALQDELACLPMLDLRAPDEILGYTAVGLFD
ncbi:MAG: hypothetical protein ACREFP_22075 [Acetobacteraceae bacterium]